MDLNDSIQHHRTEPLDVDTDLVLTVLRLELDRPVTDPDFFEVAELRPVSHAGGQKDAIDEERVLCTPA